MISFEAFVLDCYIIFSDFAMIAATVTSEVTLTTVRHMSRIRSIGIISATHIGFKPTESNTIISIINPAPGTAAAPIDARVAVATINNCCEKDKSTSWYKARKMTATA